MNMCCETEGYIPCEGMQKRQGGYSQCISVFQFTFKNGWQWTDKKIVQKGLKSRHVEDDVEIVKTTRNKLGIQTRKTVGHSKWGKRWNLTLIPLLKGAGVGRTYWRIGVLLAGCSSCITSHHTGTLPKMSGLDRTVVHHSLPGDAENRSVIGPDPLLYTSAIGPAELYIK